MKHKNIVVLINIVKNDEKFITKRNTYDKNTYIITLITKHIGKILESIDFSWPKFNLNLEIINNSNKGINIVTIK